MSFLNKYPFKHSEPVDPIGFPEAGYPPPASIQSDAETKKSTCATFQSEYEQAQTPHTTSTTTVTCDILAPFKKAPGERLCMAPYDYTTAIPGKKTVGKFIDCLRVWLGVSEESATIIENATDMMFHSSLMIDDIEDESKLRRGQPAAYVVFGMSQTVNSATYLHTKASLHLDLLKETGCKEVFLDELETLSFGQALDLYWKFHSTCPTVGDYLTMVDNKTGGFFRMALRLMEVKSKKQLGPELFQLITLVGRYYQIRDDYLNLASEEYTAKKGFCDDLSEGKLSFPLIHVLQNSPAADVLRGLLFHRSGSEELSTDVKLYILKEMKGAGSLVYTQGILTDLFEAIMKTMERVEADLGPNTRLKSFLLWLKL